MVGLGSDSIFPPAASIYVVMKLSFREFVNGSNDFSYRLREDEAAPPEGTHNDTKGAFQQEFGATDDEYDAAMETGTATLYPMNFAQKWGFLVGMPVSAIIEDGPSENLKKVTFMLRAAYQMNPNKFYRPYRQGERPYKYEGPVEDKTEYMTKSEIEKHHAKPYEGWWDGRRSGPWFCSREWLEVQEAITSTSNIASFARMSIPLVRRIWPQEVEVDSSKKNRKRGKPYMQPQVEE